MITKRTLKKRLSKLEIEIVKNGFVVWTRAIITRRGKTFSVRHWLVDASDIKNDGHISLGTKGLYQIEAEFDDKENRVKIVRRKS